MTALLALRAPAMAQGPSATAHIQSIHQNVERILRARGSGAGADARRATEVTRILTDLLDYEELSRQALGQHWTARSEPERRDFVALLQQIVERNHRENLQRTLDYQVRYEGEEQQHDNGVLVRTVARSRSQRRAPAVAIDYSMRQVGNEWKVYDITTDRVSLVRTYRSQFGRIIQRDGWPELIRRMRARLSAPEGGA